MSQAGLPTTTSTAQGIAPLTPSDSTELPPETKAIWVTADGNLVVDDWYGNANVTIAVTAGQVLPIRPRLVKTTTTATVVRLFS